MLSSDRVVTDNNDNDDDDDRQVEYLGTNIPVEIDRACIRAASWLVQKLSSLHLSVQQLQICLIVESPLSYMISILFLQTSINVKLCLQIKLAVEYRKDLWKMTNFYQSIDLSKNKNTKRKTVPGIIHSHLSKTHRQYQVCYHRCGHR